MIFNEKADRGVSIPRWLRWSGIVLVLCVLGWFFSRAIPDEWMEQEYLDALLRRAGPIAPLAYILLKTCVILVALIPSAPLDVAAGAAFGPLLGSTYSLIGSELGAIACFLIARRVGRHGIERLIKKDIVFCDQCAQKHLAFLIFFARLEPVFSFALVSYGAGLTKISLPAYAAGTFLGMAPGTIALSYYGKSLFAGSLLSQIILGTTIVALMFGVPIWIRRKNPWGLYDRMKGKDEG